MRMLRLPAALAATLLAAVLAGCGADKPKPVPLVNFTPSATIDTVWSTRLGANVGFALQPALRGDALVVAADDGQVTALNRADGSVQWRGQAGGPLAAGVGSDGRFAAVVTKNQELVVLDRGTRLWSKRLPSLTVTAPMVAGERVFVVGVDRVVHAFDAADGGRLWTMNRPGGEALTLSQPGLLAVHGDTLLVGQGASLAGVDPSRGGVRWEAALALPRGTNEVERLNDLLGPAVRLDRDIFCMRSFQSAVGCIDAGRRGLRWSRNAGGVRAVGGDAQLLAGADASDRITTWKTASGDLGWSNETLLYRGLSTPAVTAKGVWFGDFEGQVHLLARDDGRTLARMSADGSPIAGVPLVADDAVLLVTRNGTVAALRAR